MRVSKDVFPSFKLLKFVILASEGQGIRLRISTSWWNISGAQEGTEHLYQARETAERCIKVIDVPNRLEVLP